MDPPRPEVVRLVAIELPGSRLAPLAGDASTRRFYRLVARDGESSVLMDYGRPFRGTTDDQRLEQVFREAGLRVARILDSWPDPGCLRLEDLGDRLLEGVLDANPPAERWWTAAVDLAAAIAVRGTPVLARSPRSAGPTLDSGRFRFEMDFFCEHYASAPGCDPGATDELREELYRLAHRAADTRRPVLCHRDFHSRNLMILGDGSLAMVDIQDARRGPYGYDLASLLRDAYVDLDEALLPALKERYRAAAPDPLPPENFDRAFDLLAAQRMIKALGTFAYQVRIRGLRRYAGSVPRTLERLSRDLPRRDETRPLGAMLHRHGLLAVPEWVAEAGKKEPGQG